VGGAAKSARDARDPRTRAVLPDPSGAASPEDLHRVATMVRHLARTNHSPALALAHAEIGCDCAHGRAREPIGGSEDDSAAIEPIFRGDDPLGDRPFEHDRSVVDAAGGGEPIAQAIRRRLAPQIAQRDDAPGEGGVRNTEHGVCVAQTKARRHAPLEAAEDLPMDGPSSAERVDVEPVSRGRSEADDEMDLGPWNRDAGRVALELVDEERRQRGRDLHVGDDATKGAREHPPILAVSALARKARVANGRFFQSIKRSDA
jgi:hypothetical protein